MNLAVEWDPFALEQMAAAWATAAAEDRSLLTESASRAERILSDANPGSGDALVGHPVESYVRVAVLPRVPSYRHESLRVVVVGSMFFVAWVSPEDRLCVVYAAGRKRVEADF